MRCTRLDNQLFGLVVVLRIHSLAGRLYPTARKKLNKSGKLFWRVHGADLASGRGSARQQDSIGMRHASVHVCVREKFYRMRPSLSVFKVWHMEGGGVLATACPMTVIWGDPGQRDRAFGIGPDII